MSNPVSPWPQRIEQLVDFVIGQKDYTPDVSMVRVDASLNYFAMCKAKYFCQMDREVPRENPWVASLMLYVTLGDTPLDKRHDESSQFEAGRCMGMAFRAGWTIGDIFQVIEWNRDALAYYPSVEQWAFIFDVEPSAIADAQKGLVPNIEAALNTAEHTAWQVAKSLDVPFHCWARQLVQAPAENEVHLPDMSMDV